MTDKEIQQLHCWIAEVMGLHKPRKRKDLGYCYWDGACFEPLPNYTGDLNILLGEFADWLRGYRIEIRAHSTLGGHFVLIESFIASHFSNTLGHSERQKTPQEAAYHAIKQAMPRIIEIIKENK